LPSAGAALLLTGRTEDHLIEITFTTVAAYGSFLLAEHFHLLGVPDGRPAAGQRRDAGRDLGPRPRGGRLVLGVRRVRGQLAGFPFDRHPGGARTVPGGRQRGALALALVLGLPEGTPRRGEITAVAFGVVAFSIVVQGITMPPLLRRLGFLGAPHGGDPDGGTGTEMPAGEQEAAPAAP
jgi:CPA1 family monovalent cation:H+ antiporter